MSRRSAHPGDSMQGDNSIPEHCVQAINECNAVLSDVLMDLEGETRELKRISLAIAQNKLYALMPERRVRAYAMQQSAEIEPQVTELLGLAEKSLKILERKEATLSQKIETARARAAGTRGEELPLAVRGEDRKKKMLIKQRHIFEKELLALEKECKELQRKVDSR